MIQEKALLKIVNDLRIAQAHLDQVNKIYQSVTQHIESLSSPPKKAKKATGLSEEAKAQLIAKFRASLTKRNKNRV